MRDIACNSGRAYTSESYGFFISAFLRAFATVKSVKKHCSVCCLKAQGSAVTLLCLYGSGPCRQWLRGFPFPIPLQLSQALCHLQMKPFIGTLATPCPTCVFAAECGRAGFNLMVFILIRNTKQNWVNLHLSLNFPLDSVSSVYVMLLIQPN